LNATTAPQRRRVLIQHDALVSGTTASGSKWGSGLESDNATSTMAGPSPPRRAHHEHDIFVLKTTAPCSKRALGLKMTIPPQPHLATPYHDVLAPTTRAPYSKGDTGLESDNITSSTIGPSATRRSCHKDDGAGLEVAFSLEWDALALTMTAPNSNGTPCLRRSWAQYETSNSKTMPLPRR
jgi:hypothetical protein